eukprot:275890-Amorphochlora_amoeboformis.AAC.5
MGLAGASASLFHWSNYKSNNMVFLAVRAYILIEFAIAVIFVDARPYSVEFLILLSIKILCNLMVDT